MKASYDPQCETLARHFLESETWTGEAEVTELAGVIQHAIEAWWAAAAPKHKPE